MEHFLYLLYIAQLNFIFAFREFFLASFRKLVAVFFKVGYVFFNRCFDIQGIDFKPGTINDCRDKLFLNRFQPITRV
jgi:hypothetical protein